MCYTKEISLNTFIIGISSSLILILFGNKNYQKQNLGIGILFFIVSFMQLFDYMIWDDLECKKNYNKLAGKLGPLFNAIQPLILYIFILFIKQTKEPYRLDNIILTIINFLYLAYVLYIYKVHIDKNICSKVEKGRIRWSWYNSWENLYFPTIYLIVLSINVMYIIKNKYILIATLLSALFLIISKINYKYHIGEFWCYFVNSIPLIILVLQKLNI